MKQSKAASSMQAQLMTLLITADEPLQPVVLRQHLAASNPQPFDLDGLLINLEAALAPLGLRLKINQAGVRLVLSPVQQAWLAQFEPQRTPKLSRAALEILAILIVKQPITRAEIEAIRGVQVSSSSLQQLKELGWIDQQGQKQVPGLPYLWVSTDKLVQDLGLASVQQLHDELVARLAEFKQDNNGLNPLEKNAAATESAKIPLQ
ncbi:chromosome segregation and condensation protein ScpB [Thiomicrospira aerophila AL3]|uniref:Chromosome segregation and condensation protein ScpB n=1 Tax=Thiomicrospira aerophila AL3 TaxID=717772 RepID=W0DVI1_9GAMM|nr:SMC-Scp complex subunit ScpB [Thiomicrospira aerophila]AHF01278.1 chromosome segregation and condensation protein ScpB [Thiomicrospira aerophila AL3]